MTPPNESETPTDHGSTANSVGAETTIPPRYDSEATMPPKSGTGGNMVGRNVVVGNAPPAASPPPNLFHSPPADSRSASFVNLGGSNPNGPPPCPNCNSQAPALVKSEVSTIGWIVFAVLLMTTLVFCWIGILIRDKYRICSYCKIRLGPQ